MTMHPTQSLPGGLTLSQDQKKGGSDTERQKALMGTFPGKSRALHTPRVNSGHAHPPCSAPCPSWGSRRPQSAPLALACSCPGRTRLGSAGWG